MATGWKIDSQRMTKVLSASGTFKDVWEIRFETDGGVAGMIDVDVRNYTPEYVKAAIDDYVAKIDAIHNL